MTLEEQYTERFNKALKDIAINLEQELKHNLAGVEHIDRIYSRPKSVDRFLIKAEKTEKNGRPKYEEPLKQIQDQIGARVIVFYISDVEKVKSILLENYRPIEEQLVIPDSEKEFDYEGKHFIFILPKEVIPESINKGLVPSFFELQIKTLYQHAFSEASHDLAYKPNRELTRDQKRKVAFSSAQSWGADQVFLELTRELFD